MFSVVYDHSSATVVLRASQSLDKCFLMAMDTSRKERERGDSELQLLRGKTAAQANAS